MKTKQRTTIEEAVEQGELIPHLQADGTPVLLHGRPTYKYRAAATKQEIRAWEAARTPKPVPALAFKMQRDFTTGRAEVEITFKCPNCHKLHTRRESYLAIPANFSVVGYGLDCGHVDVIMPWAEGRKDVR